VFVFLLFYQNVKLSNSLSAEIKSSGGCLKIDSFIIQTESIYENHYKIPPGLPLQKGGAKIPPLTKGGRGIFQESVFIFRLKNMRANF